MSLFQSCWSGCTGTQTGSLSVEKFHMVKGIPKITIGISNLQNCHNQSAEAEQGAGAELERQNGGKGSAGTICWRECGSRWYDNDALQPWWHGNYVKVKAARQHWRNYLERNQSIIIQLFCGQTRWVSLVFHWFWHCFATYSLQINVVQFSKWWLSLSLTHFIP